MAIGTPCVLCHGLRFALLLSQLCVKGSFPRADKRVHHTLQRKQMSICSRITRRSLESHSDSSFQSKWPRRWNPLTGSASDSDLGAGYNSTLRKPSTPLFFHFPSISFPHPNTPPKKTFSSLRVRDEERDLSLFKLSNISSVPGDLYIFLNI